MILLSALRVDRWQIMEDYLMTNEVNGPKAEICYQKTIEAGGTEAEAAVVKSVFLAKETYLNEAFSAINEQYPDMDTFLQEGLYIPHGDIERFQKSVLR